MAYVKGSLVMDQLGYKCLYIMYLLRRSTFALEL
jgi:hypothetical protein